MVALLEKQTITPSISDITINGVQIPTKGILLNATSLYKAAGYPPAKTAHNFPKLKETQQLMLDIVAKYQVFNLIDSESGAKGGIYFHPILALKYAEYLGNGVDTQLKYYCNVDISTPSLEERIKDHYRNLHKLHYKQFCGVLDELGATNETYPIIGSLLTSRLYPTGVKKSVDEYSSDELQIKIDIILALQRLYLSHKRVIKGHDAIVNFAIDKLELAR